MNCGQVVPTVAVRFIKTGFLPALTGARLLKSAWEKMLIEN
tara:strand:+ start:453 stop:575 length:123 start_codon:yes stop_codon:yes gene_type:complete